MSYRKNLGRTTPFVDKPKGWRRDRFVSLRWKIAQDPNGRGLFTSHHMMDGGVYDGQVYLAPGDSRWNDFRFVSQKHQRQGLVYSGTVRTLAMAAADWAEDQAWEKEEELLSDEEYQAAHPPLEWVPAGKDLFTLKDYDDPVFDRLGGVSAWGLRAKFLREAAREVGSFQPSCRLDRSYKNGIGAVFLVDAPRITIDSLAELVNAFCARGEEAYTDAPVDFSPANPKNHALFLDLIEQQATCWENMDLRARGEYVEQDKIEDEGGVSSNRDDA